MVVAGVLLDHLNELIPPHWLVVICIKTNLLAFVLNLDSPFARQSHDWYIEIQLVLDNLGCGKAVHHRHSQIHDNETVGGGVRS